LTHFGLYLLGFLMPITGIVLAYQRNEIARVFGIGAVAAGNGFRRGGFSLGMFHGLVWILLLLLIALHVGAALYHQFFKKDNLLGRMWYGN
jgi:cytochrome b561